MSSQQTPEQPTTIVHCRACGYDLRGQQVDDTCPECGRPVAESLTREGAFMRRHLALLACRVLALWTLVQACYSLLEICQSLYTWGLPRDLVGLFDLLVWAVPLAVVIPFGIAAALWWGAPWLGRRIYPHDGQIRINATGWAWDFLLIVPVGVGVLFLSFALQRIVMTTVLLSSGASSSLPTQLWISQAAGILSYGLVGTLLVLGGPAIIRGIKWLRTAGQTPTES